MEDLYPAEPLGVDPALLLGVDLAEYFGGRDLDQAERVVVSQLKYSHRNPGRSWTAARLAERSGRRPSVIRRLADVYKALAGRTDRDRLLSVLDICLVSNRPVGAQLKRSLAASQLWLKDRPESMTFAQLRRGLDSRHHDDLKRLADESGLKSREFTDFLRVLQLDLGQLPRGEQELAITKALGRHVADDLGHHSRALYDLVRRSGTPDGFDRPIMVEDVYAALEVSGPEALFPAPSAFARTTHCVDTPDAGRMVDELRASDSHMLLAHGGAGVGKTTSALRVGEHLPLGSVVIALDCFAGGDYDKPAHARHLPERALLQLCNELAIRCQLPLLLAAPKTHHDLWRELERRIEDAVGNLEHVGAQLVIVVDAIDNAAWAARQRGDASFVADLWKLKLPAGAGLIATARTARRDQLSPPADLSQLVLSGFDESASREYLRLTFPEASADECQRFHARSQGNPRVQFYVLDPQRDGSATTAADAAHQAEKTPDSIFYDLWSSAIEQAEDPAWASERLADLMCLTPPISIERLVEVAATERSRVEAFCHALTPGLRFDPDGLTFQDEDFAKYLQDKLGPDDRQAAHSRLADFYGKQQDNDPYAATVIAEHLRGAGRSIDLLELAIDGGQPTAIADPLARLQVYLRRIRLALLYAQEGRLDAAKLLVLAARAATSDNAITEVIRRRPSLALRHGDPEAVGDVWRQDRNLSWHGPVHMRLAALYALEGDSRQAREQLARAKAWNRRRQEDEKHWELEADDLACALHAVHLVDGWTDAIRQLRQWQPRRFVYQVGECLVKRIAHDEGRRRTTTLVLRSDFSARLTARLLVAINPSRAELPAAEVARIAEAFTKEEIPPADDAKYRFDYRPEDWPIAFAELVAQRSDDMALIRRVLSMTEPTLPQRAPSRWEGPGEFLGPLRWYALRAACEDRDLTLDELMPASITAEDEGGASHDRSEQRRAMQENVGECLEIFSHRANCLLTRPTARKAVRSLAEQVTKMEEEASHRWHRPAYSYARWVAPACDVLLAARGTDLAFVRQVADSAPDIAGNGDAHVWTVIARQLIADPRYRDDSLLLIERAAAASESRPQRAIELADVLLDLADLADPYEHSLAADLYNRAVEAAAGLDDAGTTALELHARLAPKVAGHSTAPQLASRIAQSVVDYQPRVSEDGYLPWGDTLKGIAQLHPPSGIATMTRWEDQRHIRLSQSVPRILVPVVEAGLITARQAIALVTLMGEEPSQGSTLRPLLDHLKATEDRPVVADELEHISLRVRRDLHQHARQSTAKDVCAWATSNGFAQHAAVKVLKPYVETVTETPSSSSMPFQRDQVDESADPTEPASATPPDQLAARLDEVSRDYRTRESVGQVIHDAARGLRSTRRRALLDAIADLPTDSYLMKFQGDDVLEALHNLLKRWSSCPVVRQWKNERLAQFLVGQLANSVRYREASQAQLSAIVEIVGPDAAADIAITGAGLHIDQLGSDGLYSLAGQLASVLDIDDLAVFVDWSLSWLEDEPQPVATLTATDGTTVLASALWALFANPEKPIRWRAAHTARRLLTAGTGDPTLAAELLRRTHCRGAGPFADPDLEFLWMSAQTWALMTLARVGNDRGDVIAPIATELATMAFDKALPHAAIREFARRAALCAETAFDPDTADALVMTNRPASCETRRRNHLYEQAGGHRGPERWRFDYDTERYWFGRFGERFGEPLKDVARRAERWIIDVLGADPDVSSRRDDPRLKDLDYPDVNNRHGSQPRTETVELAYEYHSMLMTAGEFVDEGRAIIVEEYEPVVDPWSEWMDGHLDSRVEEWTIDRREPTPPEPTLLNQRLDKGHWPTLGEDDIEVALGRPDAESLVVDAGLNYQSQAGYAYDRVESALVAPATSASVLRAIRSADDAWLLPFPTDDDDGPFHAPINHGPFRMLGWISEVNRERTGLEEHDPLARLDRSMALPGAGFRTHHRASAINVPASIVNGAGKPIAWIQAFSDEPLSQRREPPSYFYASGRQTRVSTPALLSYLKAINMALIIRVHSVRGDSNSPDKDTTHDQELHRVVLIDQHGHIEGLPGDRALG